MEIECPCAGSRSEDGKTAFPSFAAKQIASKLFFCGFISFIVEIPPKLPLSPKKIEQSIEDG